MYKSIELKKRAPYIYTLYREVNHRIRYYSLKVSKTLFEEYALECEYGGIKNRAPTGRSINYFNSLHEALISRYKLIEKKIKKGYIWKLAKVKH